MLLEYFYSSLSESEREELDKIIFDFKLEIEKERKDKATLPLEEIKRKADIFIRCYGESTWNKYVIRKRSPN